MNIIYSNHAEKQIKERTLLKIWVEETIKFPHFVKREGFKFYAIRKLDSMTLKVVYTKETYIKVITSYFVQ